MPATEPPAPARAPTDLFDLSDRTAVVTGGSRGIGLETARLLAAAGARVVIASRKAEACDAAAAELAAGGADVLAVPCHMGKLDQIDTLVERTVAHFGGLDILVNNAANPLGLPIADLTPAAWDSSFSVNLRGPVFLAKAALPHLRTSGRGVIVNVISVGAFMFTPDQSMYGAAKAGLLAYTRSMAAEFASDGIRVNAVAPGTTDTKMTRDTGEEAIARMTHLSLLDRLAHPGEVAPAVLFLASEASSYVTGQCLTVDGGVIPAR